MFPASSFLPCHRSFGLVLGPAIAEREVLHSSGYLHLEGAVCTNNLFSLQLMYAVETFRLWLQRIL